MRSLRVKNSPPTPRRWKTVQIRSSFIARSRRRNAPTAACAPLAVIYTNPSVLFVRFSLFFVSPSSVACSTARHTRGPVHVRRLFSLKNQGHVRNTTRPPPPVYLPGDRWVVICHSNVLRDSCGPVTSDSSAVFTHHAGH